ncbi:DUF4249 domain-containing protein [Poritiphilus flavus]|uniref:DUF4249 family protein n=1 Tax=Poritiphilus flavus TaxID=2697053 RepID=A0A6L9EEB2_9FLAO|nr:DUF4249 domain-containing protein [Poritiphilus flavus]NAS13065.1 DUF4249 family protein [Poritiphilus flavus]
MIARYISNLFLLTGVFLGFQACVEPFEATTEQFENALVVDARLTDENRVQVIYLSRTFPFESEIAAAETNASVSLIDESGNRMEFLESEAGTYRSTGPMQLSVGTRYQLEIQTSDGMNYLSDPEELPSPVAIGDIQAIRRPDDLGEDGIAILVDAEGASGGTNFYRYEYEETFKIIAPDYNPFEWDEVDDVFFADGDGYEVTVAPRTEEAQTCFGTQHSLDLILASTADLSTNELDDFEVRFLKSDNYTISHRYSILVKQYHQTAEANSYFTTLEDFSSSESVFTSTQPGFLGGNIRAVNTENALVLGYFELSSYSEKRFFFNYRDFYPDEDLPPYAINCAPLGSPPLYPEGFHFTFIDGELVVDGTAGSPLISAIKAGLIDYVGDNPTYGEVIDEEGNRDRAPFYTKSKACVDCRELGSNVVPDFWIEE